MANTRGRRTAKRGGSLPARKRAARKPATRKSVAATLAVKTKVPKREAKALIDLFQGASVNVEPEYDQVEATLTMLRVSPTRIGDD